MKHVEITITETVHYHGFAMADAVKMAIERQREPSRLEITARYVIEDDE